MKKRGKWIFAFTLTVTLALLGREGMTTSVRSLEVTCPVCNESIQILKIVSTNDFGGQDTDLLSRAVGEQPILIAPVTCPKCLFSGYTDDFKETVDPAVKKKILEEKALVQQVESQAWAKYDLIAQTMALKGANDPDFAEIYLITSWAVRLEENPFDRLFSSLNEEDLTWIEKRLDGNNKNPAAAEVEVGRRLLADFASLPPEKHRTAAIAIGYYLRGHGENTALLEALPALKPSFPEDQWNTLEPQVKASIELERKYQRLALGFFEKILAAKIDGTEKNTPDDRAIQFYLSGELARRLGDPEKAAGYYDQALRFTGAPERLLNLCRDQKALLTKK